MNKLKTPLGPRIVSILIDHFFVVVVFTIALLFNILLSFGSNDTSNTSAFENIYVLLIAMSIIINKDAITGRSIGKRATKLKVIDCKSNQIASPYQCLTRNLFTVLPFVEIIFILINPNRRLGDYVAGTEVIRYYEDETFSKTKPKQVLFSFVLGFLCFGIFVIPIHLLKKILDP